MRPIASKLYLVGGATSSEKSNVFNLFPGNQTSRTEKSEVILSQPKSATEVMALGLKVWCSFWNQSAEILAVMLPLMPVRETVKTGLAPIIQHLAFLEGKQISKKD